MMNVQNAVLAMAATLGMALAAPAYAATQTVDALVETGTIFDDNNGTVSVDYWQFDVSTSGTVTIDVLARNVLGGDNISGLSGLDSLIWLFEFDSAGNQGMLGADIGRNDDFFAPTPDGSISGFDSFLSIDLAVGSYVLALSDWSFSQNEARTGLNFDGGFDGTFADYQITFTGIDVAPVPLPAALPLMMAGMGALGFVGRRRSHKKASA